MIIYIINYYKKTVKKKKKTNFQQDVCFSFLLKLILHCLLVCSVYLIIFVCLFVCAASPACKPGPSVAGKEGGSADAEHAAPECDRHIYKSVLEGGDIPLQGLRALNKRHPSTSSKGRILVVMVHQCPC